MNTIISQALNFSKELEDDEIISIKQEMDEQDLSEYEKDYDDLEYDDALDDN